MTSRRRFGWSRRLEGWIGTRTAGSGTEDREADLRRRCLDQVHLLSLVLALPGLFFVAVREFLIGRSSGTILLAAAIAVSSTAYRMRNRIPNTARSAGILLLLGILGFHFLLRFGVTGATGAYLLCTMVVLAWILHSPQVAVFVTLGGILLLGTGIFGVMALGTTVDQPLDVLNHHWLSWLGVGWGLFAQGLLVVVPVRFLVSTFRANQASLVRLATELESGVRERTAELEQSRRASEGFSRRLVEVLDTPLRQIGERSLALLSHAESELPPDGRKALDRIRWGGERMRRLVEALFGLSDLDRHLIARTKVDVREIVNDVRDELEVSQVEGTGAATVGIEWVIGDLPSCQSDPDLVRQVVANLLANAVKFTRSRVQPRIRIAALERDDGIWYEIADNGVGFDGEQAARLFQVFHRLHGSEVEGIGIGLATVRKILDRLGGAIEAEGRLDEGAVFRFRLAPSPRASGKEGEAALELFDDRGRLEGRALDSIHRALILLGWLAAAAMALREWKLGFHGGLAVPAVLVLSFSAIYFLRSRIPVPPRAVLVVLVLLGAGINSLVNLGMAGTAGGTLFAAGTILAWLLLPQRMAYGISALSTVAFLATAWHVVVAGSRNTFPLEVLNLKPLSWINFGLVFLAGTTMVLAAVLLLLRSLRENLRRLAEINTDLEVRIRTRVLEIHSARESIEAYSYTVAHDLRAPLRAIDGYCRILQEDCEAFLSDSDREDLKAILSATSRISDMIQALLELSRPDRRTSSDESVPLARRVSELVDSLDPSRSAFGRNHRGPGTAE